MIGLVRPCTGVLSQYGRNNLIALEKGDPPPKVAEWPGASIPILLSLSLGEQFALTHIQGLIRNYQVEALPESEDSSSFFAVPAISLLSQIRLAAERESKKQDDS